MKSLKIGIVAYGTLSNALYDTKHDNIVDLSMVIPSYNPKRVEEEYIIGLQSNELFIPLGYKDIQMIRSGYMIITLDNIAYYLDTFDFMTNYFDFDEYKNVVICPEKHELTLDGEYDAPPEKGGGNKLKLIYSNYSACRNCKFAGTCFTKNHRTITRYVHEVAYKTERLMASEEGINEYKLRSKTVEAHNGTFKRIYHYDDIPITGLERVQNLMFTIVASYNLIRLFSLIKENKMDLFSVISSIRFIALN